MVLQGRNGSPDSQSLVFFSFFITIDAYLGITDFFKLGLYTHMIVVDDKTYKVRKYRAVVCTAIGRKLQDLVGGKDYRFAKTQHPCSF